MNLQDSAVVLEEVINEANLSMQAQSSSAVATAELQRGQIYSVRKRDERGRNVVKASRERALVEETEYELGTSGKGGNSEKSTIFDNRCYQ